MQHETGLTKVPPVIDGILDDDAWKTGPLVDDIFIIYNQHYGDVLPQKNRVWMAHDPDNIYYALTWINISIMIRCILSWGTGSGTGEILPDHPEFFLENQLFAVVLIKSFFYFFHDRD